LLLTFDELAGIPIAHGQSEQVSLDQMRLEGSKNSHLLLGVDAFEHAPQNQL